MGVSARLQLTDAQMLHGRRDVRSAHKS